MIHANPSLCHHLRTLADQLLENLGSQSLSATVRDLLRLPEAPGLAGGFNPDPQLGRFDTNVDRLKVTAGLWQDYQRAAEQLAERATATADDLGRVLPADLPDAPAERARAFVERFGLRAFRRPLTEVEVTRYTELFAQGPTHHGDLDAFTAGVRLSLEAFLQSPHFLYRGEGTTDEVGGVYKLGHHEMASRLSYLLWSTMPDDTLFAAAAADELGTEAEVRAQAARMFGDPRARGEGSPAGAGNRG